MKYIFFLFIFSLLNLSLFAKGLTDTILIKSPYPETNLGVKFSYNQLVIPAILIGLGVYATIDSHLDKEVKSNTSKWNGHTQIDNLLPGVNPAAIYILNWSGVRGKHNFIDRSVLLGTSALLGMGSTLLIKSTISTSRPDGNGNDAFPSLHTATAFVGAECMRQEYSDQSVWYGVASYGIATCTGFLRIYNNRHWLSDVLAGAGMGILGTKAAYWLYPEIRKLYKGTRLDHALILPYGSKEGFGLSLSAKF